MEDTKITFRLDRTLKVRFDVYLAQNQKTQTETLIKAIVELLAADAEKTKRGE